MKYSAGVLLIFIYTSSFSQTSSTLADTRNPSLQERFVMMKNTSQTFQDYKVIKEVVLDGVWKIVQDSIKNQYGLLAKAKLSIKQLENEVATQKASIGQTQQSIKQIVYDSTHISFIGMSLMKSLFVTLTVLVIIGLLVIVLFIIGKLKWMNFAMREKVEALKLLTNEFEEYKKRTLEKQAKLSRELQTERNKLLNIDRGGSVNYML